ncbi:unnamed protein product [Diplocarpon coronariae]
MLRLRWQADSNRLIPSAQNEREKIKVVENKTPLISTHAPIYIWTPFRCAHLLTRTQPLPSHLPSISQM